MELKDNRLLSMWIYRLLNILFWIELIGGFAFVSLLTMTAHYRDGFALQVPVSYSSITLRKINPLVADFPFALLNTSDGNLSIPLQANFGNISMLLMGYGLIFMTVVVITFQLKKIFWNFKQNYAFTKENIWRIKLIALILIVVNVLQWLFIYVKNHILAENLNLGSLNLSYKLDAHFFFMGIALFVCAQIVKMGYILEEEQKFTV